MCGGRGSRPGFRVALAVAGGILLGLLLLAALSGRLVRSPLLSFVEQRYGITVTAASLEVDLVRLRVSGADVALAVPSHTAEPFFRAGKVVVDLPWTVVWDGPAVEALVLDGPALTVVRRADGSSNLPAAGPAAPSAPGSSGPGVPPPPGPSGPPGPMSPGAGVGRAPAVPIGRLEVRDLAIDWRDDAAGFAFRVPAMTARWPGAGEPAGGRTTTGGIATLAWRGATPRTLRFDGDLRYDGAALHVDQLTVTGDDGELTLSGLAGALFGEPSLALDYQVHLDARSLASSIPGVAVPGGVSARGSLGNSANGLELTAALAGTALELGPTTVDRFDAALRLTPGTLTVDRLRLEVGGGVVSATGGVDLTAGRPGRVAATWSDVDVARLLETRAPGGSIPLDMDASGELTAEWSALRPDAVELSARSRFGVGDDSPGAHLEVSGGRGRLTVDQRAGRAGRLTAVIDADASRTAEGSGGWREARLDGRITARCDDLAACGRLVPVPRVQETLGGLQGTVMARFAVGGSLGRPDVTGEVRAPVLTLAGGALQGLSVRVEADPQDVRVRVPRFSDGRNEAEAVLRLRLADRAVEGWFAADLSDPGSLPLPIPPHLAPAGRGRIEGTFGGRAGSIEGVAAVEFEEFAVAGRRLGSVQGRARLDRAGRLRGGLELPDLAAALDGEVDLPGPGPFAVRGYLRDTDLGRLAAPALPLAAHVTGDVFATGTLADLGAARVEVRLVEAAGRLGDAKLALTGPGAVVYEAGALRVPGLGLDLGRTRLRLAGGLGPAGDEVLTAHLEGDAGDVADLVAAARGLGPSDSGPRAAGDISVTLVAGGRSDAVDLSGALRIDRGSLAVGDHPPLTGIAVRAALRRGILSVDRARAAWRSAEIDATAELPLDLGAARLPASIADLLPAHRRPGRLRARIGPLSPGLLKGYVDPDVLGQMDGHASALLELQIPASGFAASRGRLMLTEAEFEVAGVPVAQRRPTVVALDEGRLTLAAFDWASGRDLLAMGGTLQLAGDRPTDAWAEGEVDLRTLSALAPALAETGLEVGGSARLRASATGPLAAVAVRGTVEIAGGELRVAEPPLSVTDLDGVLSLDGQTVTVRRLAGIVNGGRLAAGGGWTIGPSAESRGFTVTGTGVALDYPRGLRTVTDLALAIREEEQRLALTGSVTVLRGAYREPITLAGGLIEAFRTRAAATATPGDRLGDGVRLDVRVSTTEDVVVDNNYVEAEVGGSLRVGGTTQAPALTGRVAVREGGRVRFGGRVYEIETGAVDFVDPEAVAPEVTLTARTSAGGYDITLDVEGGRDDLSTSLRSEPPLSEPDVASVLLTGRPLGEGEAPLSAAREQVLGLVSTELLGQAGRGVGLELQLGPGAPGMDSAIRFDPSIVSTDRDPTSRLTASRRLGDDVRIVFSRSLRENDLVWFADYLPRRDIELRAFFDDEDERAYEFRHAVTGNARSGRARARPSRPTRVSAVAVRAEPGVGTASLRRLLELRAGDRFEFQRQQRDRDRLAATLREQGYLEARVRARQQPGPGDDTVALTYDVVRGPRTDLVVTGYDLPPAVHRDIEALWTRAVFDTFLLGEIEVRVAEHLAERGHLRAAVEARLASASGATASRQAGRGAHGAHGTKRIEVRVAPGPRTDERELRLEGPAPDDELALRERLRDRALDRVAWTDPRQLADAVEEWYRDRGHLQASAAVGEPRFAGRRAELPVRVDAGPRFRIGTVEISGAWARPAAEVRAEAALEAGAVYTDRAVAAARTRIRTAYRRAGHAAATVRLRRELDPAHGTVDLHLDVVEGPRQVVHSVVVEGAPHTDPNLVETALAIEAGAAVDPTAWNQARRRLYDTGVFRSVDIEARALAGARAAGAEGTAPVEARVRLEEWPRYRFRYGFRVVDNAAALGETTGRTLRLGAVSDLSRRNLFGRGLTGGVSARVDRGQQAVRAFLTVPRLLGRPIETNIFASRRRETDRLGAAGVIDITTATVEQRLRPRAGVMLAVSANLDLSRMPDAVSTPESPYEGPRRTARIDGSAVVDTRDNLFDATRGFYHSSNVEYGAELGGPRTHLRYLGQQFVYRRVGRVVLATAGRLGLATGFGTDLPITERYFAGGGNTVRGYAQDSLRAGGYQDLVSGGNALLVLNQEVRIPLWSRFAGVAFLDAGNVFPSVRRISVRDLRVGAGFGLRVESPIGLLRLDYGVALRRRPDEPRGRLFVSLGQAF